MRIGQVITELFKSYAAHRDYGQPPLPSAAPMAGLHGWQKENIEVNSGIILMSLDAHACSVPHEIQVSSRP
jgi:hypothetical protein